MKLSIKKGNDYMKKNIKSLLEIIIIILLILGLFSIIDSNIAMSSALVVYGLLIILNGYSSYVKEKKRKSILRGLFVIIASIVALILRNL